MTRGGSPKPMYRAASSAPQIVANPTARSAKQRLRYLLNIASSRTASVLESLSNGRFFCKSRSVPASELSKIPVDETIDSRSIGNRDLEGGREKDGRRCGDCGKVL